MASTNLSSLTSSFSLDVQQNFAKNLITHVLLIFFFFPHSETVLEGIIKVFPTHHTVPLGKSQRNFFFTQKVGIFDFCRKATGEVKGRERGKIIVHEAETSQK